MFSRFHGMGRAFRKNHHILEQTDVCLATDSVRLEFRVPAFNPKSLAHVF
jgi:hypothetical protein